MTIENSKGGFTITLDVERIPPSARAEVLNAARAAGAIIDGGTIHVCARKMSGSIDSNKIAEFKKRMGPRWRAVPSSGPGTELKKLLKKAGIEATPNCSCNARARVMDERGIEWCEANIDQIVGWLREEATNRGLPFVDMAGRMLVKRAIRNAKKAAAQTPQ